MNVALYLLLAMDPATQAARVRLAMQHGLDAQRKSVTLQAESLRPALFVRVPTPGCNPLPAQRLNGLIQDAARVNGVNPSLIREVARRESAFKPCAVSRAGAEGLMQLMPATQIALGVKNPFDSEEALYAGGRLLRELLERYHGNLGRALAAYNAGPRRVDREGSIPVIPETQEYVRDILSRLDPKAP